MKTNIIPALDGLDIDEARRLVGQLHGRCYAFKIHDLFDRRGGVAIDALAAGGARIWVDVKLHDIPATVAGRAGMITSLGADIITVHASGGIAMMEAAVKATQTCGTEIYAITLLTSLSPEYIAKRFKNGENPSMVVLDLARDAKKAGVHGVVCSPQEVGLLSRQEDLAGMKFIVPGVRSPGADQHDQQRTGTPRQAFADGASAIVVGRQITQAEDPVAAFDALVAEITAEEVAS